MQSITPVTTDQLLAPGQEPLLKFEIYNNASWINLCNLHSPIGLVGWWAFDEGAGMVAYDHSKYGNHGSLENMTEADWVDGKVGKALDFDGENDYVEVPDDDSLDFGTDDFTIALWVKIPLSGSSTYEGIISKGYTTDAPAHGWGIVRYGSIINRLSYQDAIDAGGAWNATLITGVLSNGWHHICVKRVGNVYYLYVDKIEVDSVTATTVDLTNASNLMMGAWSNLTRFIGTTIDEVLIYKRALTASEIKALFELKGKNYVEDISVSLGGAGMTPNPVAGSLSATLSNEDSIFHPEHPTSAYIDWLKTGRKVRASIGARYNDTDYYWQRIIGVIDEPRFSMPDYKVSISGGDFMKFLEDAQFGNLNNYWGTPATFSSIASDGLVRTELYNEVDAMDINNEANNVAGWGVYCGSFVSQEDDGAGSVYVGKAIITVAEDPYIFNSTFTPEANTQYHFKFKYRRVTGTGWGNMRVIIYQNNGVTDVELARKENLRKTDFTAIITKNINDKIDFKEGAGSELNIILDAGIYTIDKLCAEIKEKMEWAGDLTYTVSYSTPTGKFTIAASGEFSLLWKTGINGSDNTDLHAGTTLGYDDSADDTGASSYVADNSRTYTQEEIWFTSQGTQPIQIWLEWHDFEVNVEFRVDQFSFFKFIPYWKRYYELPAGAKGPYRVLLDDVDVWQGQSGEGWYYAEDAEPGPDPPAHPARIVFFDPNKKVHAGTDNLVIHYFTAEAPENVVADILVKAKLYADRAAALTAMDYTATGITIDRNWFKVGSPYLSGIKLLCERCDYRFFFKYDGTPSFKPKPAPAETAFTFTHQKHIASVSNYQDRGEIWNRIIIEGEKQAEPVNKEETLSSELRGEAHDDTSIGLYGERTLPPIKNHLFQTQASIDAMKATLLAEYKDPKLYADVETEYLPAPLELGNKISFKERLSPTLELTETGVIRDIKISSFNTIYKCVK